MRPDNPKLLDTLRAAIEAGTPMMIENMPDSIEPVLGSLVSRTSIRRGNHRYVPLGAIEAELHDDFRLYLHTKLLSPEFPPEVQAETTMVNFTVTQEGLEEQLLANVVQVERADLARRRTRLVETNNAYKVRVAELEERILVRLSNAGDDISEDEDLISGLEDAKRLSVEIEGKMKKAALVHKSISAVSELYRPVAQRGALLFFLLNSLARVHSFYVFSLEAVQRVFLRGIASVSEGHAKDAALALISGVGVPAAPKALVPNSEAAPAEDESPNDATRGTGASESKA